MAEICRRISIFSHPQKREKPGKSRLLQWRRSSKNRQTAIVVSMANIPESPVIAGRPYPVRYRTRTLSNTLRRDEWIMSSLFLSVILRRLADDRIQFFRVASRHFDSMLHFIQHDREKRRYAGIMMSIHGKEHSDVAIHTESVKAVKDRSPRPDRSDLAMTNICHFILTERSALRFLSSGS